jgi:hypothetical protein
MNPLASGVLFAEEAGTKYLVRVCVVSLAIGIGGREGLRCCPGGCADAVLTNDCSATEKIKATVSNKDVRFLFIIDLFLLFNAT